MEPEIQAVPPIPSFFTRHAMRSIAGGPWLILILSNLVSLLVGLTFAKFVFVPATIQTVQPIPTPTPIIAIPSEVDLQTYINTKYNFSLIYPASWSKVELNNGNTVNLLKNSNSYVSITFKPNPSQKSVRDWVIAERLLPNPNNISTHIQDSDVVIGNTPSIRLLTPVNGGQDTTYIPTDKVIIEISDVFISGSLEDYTSLVENYNNILSTFKFTNTEPMFSDTNYGFSFIHPKDFFVTKDTTKEDFYDNVTTLKSKTVTIKVRAIHDIDIYSHASVESVAKREVMDSGFTYVVDSPTAYNYPTTIVTLNATKPTMIATVSNPNKNLFIEVSISDNTPDGDISNISLLNNNILRTFKFLN